MVNEVNFVRKCIATDTSQYDLWGKLVCTNFKISFITDDPMPLQVCYYLLHYITATNVIGKMDLIRIQWICLLADINMIPSKTKQAK